MPTLTIDNQTTPRIILVDAPDTSISVQEIVDALRDWEDESVNSDDDKILDAEGKAALSGFTTQYHSHPSKRCIGF